MEFAQLIRERYSVRRFTAEPVTDAELQSILEAARLAPTAVNKQPQRLWYSEAPGASKNSGHAPSTALTRPWSSRSAPTRQKPGCVPTTRTTPPWWMRPLWARISCWLCTIWAWAAPGWAFLIQSCSGRASNCRPTSSRWPSFRSATRPRRPSPRPCTPKGGRLPKRWRTKRSRPKRQGGAKAVPRALLYSRHC